MSVFWWPRRGGGSSVTTPPTAPTITVADNANGTGGVVTVAGGDAGSTHTAYAGSFAGTTSGAITWATAGSRSGNGAIAVAPGNGHYFWYVLATSSGGSAASNVAYQPLTSGTEAMHYRCMTAIQARIQALALTAIASNSVRVQKLPWAANIGDVHTYAMPAIVISPLGSEHASPTAGVNVRDDYGFPCLVAIVAVDNRDLETNHARYLLWREKIARAFQNQRISGVTESINSVVEPQQIIDPTIFTQQHFHSALVVRCFCRATRGLT